MRAKPWPIAGKPFAVQTEGLARATGRRGFLWLMEQGLGKTPVALADFERLSLHGEVTDLVVVCPNSLKTNWVDEGARWKSSAGFRIWDSKKPWGDKSNANAHVFNYESLLSSGGDYIEKLLEGRRCMLVLDECHRIKNPNSTITKRIIGHFSKFAVIKRGLTGTPMTNTVVDFYPQLRLAGALNGVNPVVFRNTYGVSVAGFKGHRKTVGVKNEDALWPLIDEWGFRATKSEWADLPEKLYRTTRIALADKLRSHYLSMLEEFVVMLDDTTVTTEQVAGQYLKLQQISSGFIYDGKSVHELMPMKDLPKFQALMDVIDANGPSSKTLVFAHFRPSCSRLIEAISATLKQPVAYIVGGMKDEEVRAQKTAFNSATGPQVMVLQLSAGKEGHTLLGDQETNPCHTVCYFENNFNLVDRAQSEDRPHRYGQRNAVLYDDFTSSPIEGLIIAAYQKKKKLIDYVLDNRQVLTKPVD